MTMVAGGLAGASPHMISATVTAISRLVFEFKGRSSYNAYAVSSADPLTYFRRLYLPKNAYRNPNDNAGVPILDEQRDCQIYLRICQTHHPHPSC
jgi:hypothetical protein